MLSIIISQYKTEQFTRLCLRSIRKYSHGPVQTIVVDNNSRDGSVEYLRGLPWIELIENSDASIGSMGHWEGLELGRRKADGDWVCFMHSDTIVLKDGWDVELLGLLDARGAVGLATTVRDLNMFESGPERFKRNILELRTTIKRMLSGRGQTNRKVLSHCFIVKKSLLEDSGYDFRAANGEALNEFYTNYVEGRHPFLLIGRNDLEQYIWHTSNVTSIVTGNMRDARMVGKFNHKKDALLAAEPVRLILADDSLDE